MRALAASFLLLVPSSALAFECSHSETHCFVSLWWPTRDIPLAVEIPPAAQIPSDDILNAIDGAATRWNEVGCSDVRLFRSGEPVDTEIVIVERGWDAMQPDAVGLTTVFHDPTTGRIGRASVLINEPLVGVTAADDCAGAYDLETVLTHELGHLLGIAHPCETQQTYPEEPLCPPLYCEDLLASWEPDERVPTMWPVVGTCDRQLATLEADDVAALCTVYPSAEPARQCFSLPETMRQSLVASEAFGCSASGRLPSLWVLLLIPLLARARRRSRAASEP